MQACSSQPSQLEQICIQAIRAQDGTSQLQAGSDFREEPTCPSRGTKLQPAHEVILRIECITERQMKVQHSSCPLASLYQLHLSSQMNKQSHRTKSPNIQLVVHLVLNIPSPHANSPWEANISVHLLQPVGIMHHNLASSAQQCSQGSVMLNRSQKFTSHFCKVHQFCCRWSRCQNVLHLQMSAFRSPSVQASWRNIPDHSHHPF